MQTKRGLLLVNLGTPSSATPTAIKRYLGEFLRDRHVVDINPILWLPILYGIVIPKRLQYITQHYQEIWLNNQSPLLYYSQQLQHKVQNKHPQRLCELAMTYGEPDLKTALVRLKRCQTIDVLCLYPQYSTTTTLAAINKIKLITKHWQNPPYFNYIHDYAEHPFYISALVDNITEQLKSHPFDVLLLSYHGIPISYIEKRQDEYVKRCELTTARLNEKLAQRHPDLEVIIAYQSRFGKSKWTEPNTSNLLIELAKQQKSVAVICPGFAVDCIETLHEINIQNRELFIQSGGKDFHYIAALNESPLQVDLISQLIKAD